ncbi:MAG: MFS transporter [Gammaproteobacteria bacterium]|nr:MFS transporter [Gammaproteobacteria bacterium]
MKDNAGLKYRIIVGFSIVMVGTAGNAFTPFAPSIIGALVDYLDFSLETAGRLASLEFGATSLGTIASVFYLHRPRLNLKRVALVCLGILVACNAVTIFAYDSVTLFSTCRFVSGFTAGVTWCTAAVAVTRVRDVERTTAILYGSPYLMGAIGLTLLPMIYPYYGVTGAYYTIILICIAAVPFLMLYYPEDPRLSSAGEEQSEGLADNRVQWLALGVLLLALFINYAANSGIWSYFERLGVSYGHAAKTVGPIVGASQLVALAGMFCAAALGGRLGEIKPILAGTVLITASTFFLFYSASLTVFFCATAVFNFSITFLTPYYFILLGRMTPSGRGVLWGNLILWLGFSSGPALVSLFLENGNFDLSIAMTIVGFIISAILVLVFSTINKERAQPFSA